MNRNQQRHCRRCVCKSKQPPGKYRDVMTNRPESISVKAPGRPKRNLLEKFTCAFLQSFSFIFAGDWGAGGMEVGGQDVLAMAR